MKMPRDLSSGDLVKALAKLGYSVTRRRGSHLRLTTQQRGEHHVTIPDRSALRIGTLSSILADIAEHGGMTRGQLYELLFG